VLSRDTAKGREAVNNHAARVAAMTAKRRAMGLAAESVSESQATQKKPELRKPQPSTGNTSTQASQLESQEERLARIRAGLKGFQSQEPSGQGQGQRSGGGSARKGGRKQVRKQDFEESNDDWDVPADVLAQPWFRADVAAPTHGNPAEDISTDLSNMLHLKDPRNQPLIPGRGSRSAAQRPKQFTIPLYKLPLKDQARVAMSVSPVIPSNRKGNVLSVLSKYGKK
jgi:hypothetical protein